MKPKVLVIVGPTASGKSDLAVELSLKFNGEIISADSRQVYKGLDIGTGKITPAEMKGVPHHLLDVADPKDTYTVADWKSAAETAIRDIAMRGKLPIICGGTGFYIDALLNNLDLPDIDVDPDEQESLEKEPVENLFSLLEKLDPRRAADMQANGSYKNPRRLARAILLARELGAVPELVKTESKYDAFIIGILPSDDLIKERIHKRLLGRIDQGMIEEAERLHMNGLSYERMNDLGLEYRYLAQLLQKQLTCEQFTEILNTRIWQYARRQKTWWKKNKSIHWVNAKEELNTAIVSDFLG